MTDNIKTAEDAMGIKADATINLLNTPKTPAGREGGREYQRHVAIEWEGGVIWLNMFDFVNYDDAENPHFCIDTYMFRNGEQVPIGTWGMIQGRRLQLDESDVPEENRLRAYGWPAVMSPVMIIEP